MEHAEQLGTNSDGWGRSANVAHRRAFMTSRPSDHAPCGHILRDIFEAILVRGRSVYRGTTLARAKINK